MRIQCQLVIHNTPPKTARSYVLISNAIAKWKENPKMKFLVIQNFDFEKAYDLAKRKYIIKQLRDRKVISEEKKIS